MNEIIPKRYRISSFRPNDPKNIQEIKYDLWEAEQKLKQFKLAKSVGEQISSEMEVYRLSRMNEKKDKLQSILSEDIKSEANASRIETKNPKQLNTVDLGNGNKITINQEEQIIGIGSSHKFRNFDEIIRIYPKRVRATRSSQIKGGVILLYAIANYGQDTPQKLAIGELIKFHDDFKENWTNRNIGNQGPKKKTFSDSDCFEAQWITEKCGLKISIEKTEDQISIKNKQ